MNCMEFQRELNADPRGLSTDALGHAETCADCARRMASQIKLEAQWEADLRIASPAGLEERILLATQIGRQKRQRLYALAASLVAGVALALSLNVLQFGSDTPDLIAMAVEHVQGEPEHLLETRHVEPEALNRLLAQVGAHASGTLHVTYANACQLPNGDGGHVVLETHHGRVTLMLIPHGKTDAMLRRTTHSQVVEVHAARYGSYALVAPNDLALTEAKALLARQLRWM